MRYKMCNFGVVIWFVDIHTMVPLVIESIRRVLSDFLAYSPYGSE